MANGRLTAIITALLFLGASPAANAAYTLGQLRTIEGLIGSKNCGSLLGYLSANPELLEGTDPLAVELRNFVLEVELDLVECLSDPGTTQQLPPAAGAAAY